MNEHELNRLSALARISLSEQEKIDLSRDLASLLSLCDALTQAAPTSQEATDGAPSVTRADAPSPCTERTLLLKEAPASRDGFFEIP